MEGKNAGADGQATLPCSHTASSPAWFGDSSGKARMETGTPFPLPLPLGAGPHGADTRAVQSWDSGAKFRMGWVRGDGLSSSRAPEAVSYFLRDVAWRMEGGFMRVCSAAGAALARVRGSGCALTRSLQVQGAPDRAELGRGRQEEEEGWGETRAGLQAAACGGPGPATLGAAPLAAFRPGPQDGLSLAQSQPDAGESGSESGRASRAGGSAAGKDPEEGKDAVALWGPRSGRCRRGSRSWENASPALRRAAPQTGGGEDTGFPSPSSPPSPPETGARRARRPETTCCRGPGRCRIYTPGASPRLAPGGPALPVPLGLPGGGRAGTPQSARVVRALPLAAGRVSLRKATSRPLLHRE